MYKISIIHPSRNRPKQCEETVKNWLSKAGYPETIEYIISVDKSDVDLSRYKDIGIRNGTYVSVNGNKTAIEAINNAAKVFTANIIIVVSDDFDCPEKWDELILERLEDEEDFFLKTKDGIQEWIITLPIMDRKCYNFFGYIYNPGYMHMFCDTEMAAVGHMTGRTIYSDLLFKHNHYSTGKNKKDRINKKNNETWNQGKKLFFRRKAINFGLNKDQILRPFPKQLE